MSTPADLTDTIPAGTSVTADVLISPMKNNRGSISKLPPPLPTQPPPLPSASSSSSSPSHSPLPTRMSVSATAAQLSLSGLFSPPSSSLQRSVSEPEALLSPLPHSVATVSTTPHATLTHSIPPPPPPPLNVLSPSASASATPIASPQPLSSSSSSSSPSLSSSHPPPPPPPFSQSSAPLHPVPGSVWPPLPLGSPPSSVASAAVDAASTAQQQRRPSMAPPPLPSTATQKQNGATLHKPPPPPPPPPQQQQATAATTIVTPLIPVPLVPTPLVPPPPPPAASSAASLSVASTPLVPSPAPVPAPSAVAVTPSSTVPSSVTFVPLEVDPGKSDEERLKRFHFRARVAAEMLSTEQTYVASLHTLQQVWIKNLRDGEEKAGVLSDSQCDTLFSNIPLLYAFQTQFLEALRNIVQKWTPETQEMGSFFLRYASFLKMYSSYVNNYDYACSLLQKLEKNDHFVSFCTKLRESSPTPIMSLQSYLIVPVQRIPRYLLLLKELLRYTSPAHADHALLTRAIGLINDVAMHINEAVRKQQNTQSMLNLQERFSNSLQLIGANTNGVGGPRRFVKQGPLCKKGRRNDSRYEFFLFTDFLIYARTVTAIGTSFGFGTNSASGANAAALSSASSSSALLPALSNPASRYKLHRKIFINEHLSLGDVPDGPNDNDKNCMQILSAEKSFIVYARDSREKAEWMHALREVVEEFKKSNEQSTSNAAHGTANNAAGTTSSSSSSSSASASSSSSSSSSPAVELGSRQPVFTQFTRSSVCSLCSTPCSFTTGRHHCRCCGAIVDASCSRSRVYLQWTKECSRTCDVCVRKLKEERSAKLEKIARINQAATQQANATAAAAAHTATATTTTPATPSSNLTTPVASSSSSSSPSPPAPSGAPPAIPARPSKPHQDSIFRLLNELLETTQRIEPTIGEGVQGNRNKPRAMSVLVRPTAISTASTQDQGATLMSPLSSVSSALAPSTPNDALHVQIPSSPLVLSSPLSLALPVSRFSSSNSERAKVVGRLDFMRQRQTVLGSAAAASSKVRSHSVLVRSGTGGLMSPPTPGSSGGAEENDGLSDSDEEAESSQISTINTPSSNNSNNNVLAMERADSASNKRAGTGRLSFSEAVEEEEEQEEEAGEKKQVQESADTNNSNLLPPDSSLLSSPASSSSSPSFLRSTSLTPSVPPPPPRCSATLRFVSLCRALFPFIPAPSQAPAPDAVAAVAETGNDQSNNNKAAEAADGQLALQAGEIVLVTDKTHEEWWRGEVWSDAHAAIISNAATTTAAAPIRSGLFPSSFVFEFARPSSSSSSTPIDSKEIESSSLYECLGDYSPSSDLVGHLSFSSGDLLLCRAKHANGWWQMQHSVSRVIGWSPSNFLQPCAKFAALNKEQEEMMQRILNRGTMATHAQANLSLSTSSSALDAAAAATAGVATASPTAKNNTININATTPSSSAAAHSIQSPPPLPAGRPRLSSGAGSSPLSTTPCPSSSSSSSAAPPILPTRSVSKSFSIPSSAGGSSLLDSPSPSATSSGVSAFQGGSVRSSSSSLAPPALPARPPARAYSVFSLHSGGGTGGSASHGATMPSEKRRSIMDRLTGFFTIRPTKEELIQKHIIIQ